MTDWIDEEKARRDQGVRHPLTQDQHAAVNARYPGCTLEHCFLCNSPTGRAGRGEDSLYTDTDAGPFCEACWEETVCQACEGTGEAFVCRNSKGEVDYIDGAPTNETARCDMCRGEGYRV